MPASTGYAGRGSKLASSPDGTTFTNIAQVNSLKHSGLKANLDDITNFDSPNAYEENIPTTLVGGTISFSGVYDPVNASQKNLKTLLDAQTLEYWKITLPNAVPTVITFQGYVTMFTPVDISDVKKHLAFSAEITINGPITIT